MSSQVPRFSFRCVTLSISQQGVLCQEDEQEQLQGSQGATRADIQPLCQLLLFPFLSSESPLDVTCSLLWEAAPCPWRSSAGMGLVLCWLGCSLPQGRPSLSCWFAGRAFPCIPWIPGASPPCGALGGDREGRKELHIPVGSGLFA